VRVVVLVADKDSFAGSAHAIINVVFFEALEAREDGGVFFWLRFFRAECVVGERVEADCFRLVGIEGVGKERWVGGLQGGGCYG
jgi:hypothetical protein